MPKVSPGQGTQGTDTQLWPKRGDGSCPAASPGHESTGRYRCEQEKIEPARRMATFAPDAGRNVQQFQLRGGAPLVQSAPDQHRWSAVQAHHHGGVVPCTP